MISYTVFILLAFLTLVRASFLSVNKLYAHSTSGCQKGYVHDSNSFFTIQKTIPSVLVGSVCADQTIVFQGYSAKNIGITQSSSSAGPVYSEIDVGLESCRTYDVLFSFNRVEQFSDTNGTYTILNSDGIRISYIVFYPSPGSCPSRYIEIETNTLTDVLVRQDLRVFEDLSWNGVPIEKVGVIRLTVTTPDTISPATMYEEGLKICMQLSTGLAYCRQAFYFANYAVPDSFGQEDGPLDGLPIFTTYAVVQYKSCQAPSTGVFMKSIVQRKPHELQLTYSSGDIPVIEDESEIPGWNIVPDVDFELIEKWQILNGPKVKATQLGGKYARDVCFRMWDKGDARYIFALHTKALSNRVYQDAEIYNSKQEFIQVFRYLVYDYNVDMFSIVGPGMKDGDAFWAGPFNGNVPENEDDNCALWTSSSPSLTTNGLHATRWVHDLLTDVPCDDSQYITCMVEIKEGEGPLDFLVYHDTPRESMRYDERPLINTTNPFQLVRGPLVNGSDVLNGTDYCKATWDDGKQRKIYSMTEAMTLVSMLDSTIIYDSNRVSIGHWGSDNSKRFTDYDSLREGELNYIILPDTLPPNDFIWASHGLPRCRNWMSSSAADYGSAFNTKTGVKTVKRCHMEGYIGCLVEILQPTNEGLDFAK